MRLQRILDEAFPDESGAARVQQIGLFTLIYVFQGDRKPVTAGRLSKMTGQSAGDISKQVKKLVDLDLIDRTQILNVQGRGRAFKLTVKSNSRAKRLTRAIDKASSRRK